MSDRRAGLRLSNGAGAFAPDGSSCNGPCDPHCTCEEQQESVWGLGSGVVEGLTLTDITFSIPAAQCTETTLALGPVVATFTFRCTWDLDGSGSVGTADLLDLLAQWGTDPGGPPDFNGDGTVSTSDLLELLANWGPCP